LYSMRGDDEAARQQFERALSLHPDYLDCIISLGRHECRMGRHEVAAEHFRRAVGINDQHVETYVGLAMAMRRMSDRATAAAEVLGSAARISKNSAVLVAQIGALALARGDETCVVPTSSEIRQEWIEDQLDRDGIILAQHPGWNDV